MGKTLKSEPKVWKRDYFEETLDGRRNWIDVEVEFVRRIYGNQPADERGIRGFVEHHLGLTGDEAEAAIERIRREELGEKDLTPPDGEVPEKLTYGLRAIRKDELGLWVGDWQIKACLKQAASAAGIWQAKRGTKRALAEYGEVRAIGPSRRLGPHHGQPHVGGRQGQCGKRLRVPRSARENLLLPWLASAEQRAQRRRRGHTVGPGSEGRPVRRPFVRIRPVPDRRSRMRGLITVFQRQDLTGTGPGGWT